MSNKFAIRREAYPGKPHSIDLPFHSIGHPGIVASISAISRMVPADEIAALAEVNGYVGTAPQRARVLAEKIKDTFEETSF